MKIGKIESFIHHLILIILAILFILPLLWMIFSSVDASAIQALKIPEKFTFQNYLAVITDSSIIRSYWIGVLLSGGQSIIVVIVSILAAYPLSRYQSKFNKPFLFTILFLTSLPDDGSHSACIPNVFDTKIRG